MFILVTKQRLEESFLKLWERIQSYFASKKHTHNTNDINNLDTTIQECITSITSKNKGYIYNEENNSFVAGKSSEATGQNAFAEGWGTYASGNQSHAEGNQTIASAPQAHAEGWGTQAANNGAHAEGDETIASGAYSHAEGERTIASGNNSHVEGYGTVASGENSHVQGTYNKLQCAELTRNNTSIRLDINEKYYIEN